VRGGGHLVAAFKSGFCNEFSTVRWEMAPGPLREAAGFHYQEFSSLRQPLALKDDPFHAGSDNSVSEWAEMILLDTAKGLAYYDHPFFEKYAAITRNSFGKGTLTYEGTLLSDVLQERVLTSVLQLAGLTGLDQTLPPNVRVKHGVNRKGKTLHYFLNYSSDTQTFAYSFGGGSDLLTQAGVEHGQSLKLKPWDAAIIEEK
jgi:beta-galactosidase